MKKIWIGLCLAAAMCLPLAGCAGNKTGGEIDHTGTVNPTAQTTHTPTPTATPHPTDEVLGGDVDSGETNTNAANGGNNVSGTPVGDENARIGTSYAAGRANDSALERVGDGVQDTLDDLGNGARSMAQDAKRAME